MVNHDAADHGGHHSDDEHEGHDEHEQDNGEWVRLLPPAEQREVLELDRARREVERQMIHRNQAKLAGRSENDRRGVSRRASSNRVAGAGVASYSNETMSHMYSQEVEVGRLAALLPRPGDGEKERQLPFQWMWDMAGAARFSSWYAAMSLAITLAAVGVYLYETDLDDDHTGGGTAWTRQPGLYPSWFTALEHFFLIFFAADLLLGAIMVDHDWGFWMTTETFVEVLSLLPSLLYVAFDLRLWGFLRFLRVLRWTDMATLDARRRRFSAKELDDGSLSQREAKDGRGLFCGKVEALVATLKLTFFVLRFLLVMAGVAVLIDRTEGGIEDLSDPDFPLIFSNAVYMSAMLLSTVGEGGHGPVPVSPYVRCAAAAAVLVFLPLAAIRVADVVKHSDTSESLLRSRIRQPAVRERRLVAVGTVTDANLKSRLHEIFHLDHGKHKVQWVRVVVVSPEPPTPRMRALIESPRYRGRVTYIQGSPLDDDCLLRAGVDNAAAVMVLANKLARSSHVEDMNVSLQAISVMTHIELMRRQGSGPKLLVELVDPNAALHLRAAGIRQVISSDQLRLSVLAQSCLCPGWSAVVANFLESRSPLPPQVLEQGSWIAEYYVGAKKTFYSVEFSPTFHGMLFGDAVVHIFELFELILVAVESRRAGAGELVVLVNPSGGYRIGRGDRAFVLAETQADARVIWDYMSRDNGPGGAAPDFVHTPEGEEASAMEILGTAGIAAMGPQAFVDSMIFSRTLIQCQRRLPKGASTDPSLILEWSRQFQWGEPQTSSSSPSHAHGNQAAGATASGNGPSQASGIGALSGDCGAGRSGNDGAGATAEDSKTDGELAASTTAAEDIVESLKSVEVSGLDGDEACRRLVALQKAAAASKTNADPGSAARPVAGAPSSHPASTEAAAASQAQGGGQAAKGDSVTFQGRRVSSAKHLKGHVVVLGFPARPSHLECFLRPLKGWSGGGRKGGGGVPVVMLGNDVDQLESALAVVDRIGRTDTNDVFLLEGSCVSYADLENAGIRTAKTVLVMKDPRRRVIETSAGDPLLDAESLVSFMKMEDGLLTNSQHVVVELENPTNVRFLHARSDGRSLHAIAGLGGAGAGGPADDAMYLWPKYAAGMTYSASFLDALFGQAFYRPSRLALLESLLLLNRSDDEDPSQANRSVHRRRQQATALDDESAKEGEQPAKKKVVREAVLRQMVVPPNFVEHSFGELFQHLAAPPLRCVAFALRRSRGTRNAPEPYVYTGPRADTVLNAGDRVFVLGSPPEL